MKVPKNGKGVAELEAEREFDQPQLVSEPQSAEGATGADVTCAFLVHRLVSSGSSSNDRLLYRMKVVIHVASDFHCTLCSSSMQSMLLTKQLNRF